ncbi:hypothetical protein [Aeromonas veronii]|uniref:hypothetical protein n=1 Tax=Aeromonas veronii TaxID=654 RepID=UPI002443A1A6|nr:hypothetical protein [Aeromonas veronii]
MGQHQSNQYSLAAPNAVATLAAKLQDGADPLLPTGQLHAIAWLVTGNSETALADALTPLCTILPLPEWCAALRRLAANNDTMSQPTAAKVPRWKADEPLSWDPLRPARMALGAELAQLESLAQGGRHADCQAGSRGRTPRGQTGRAGEGARPAGYHQRPAVALAGTRRCGQPCRPAGPKQPARP